MDLIDRKIYCELGMNCRTPISKIAKKLRVGRNVVAYRIKNLEKEGFIIKYITAINLGLLGYKTYKLNIKINNGHKDEKKFVQEMVNNRNVIYFLKNEGDLDYSATIVVKTIKEFDDFIMDLKSKFNDLIKEHFISIVVYSKVYKADKILLGKKANIQKFEKYTSEEKEFSLDEKDVKILRVLSQQANIPIVELSRKTKLSLDVVKHRLKKLSKSVINAFRIIPNLNRLGLYHYVFMLKLKNTTKKDENKLVEWCAQKQNVMYCTKRIGHFDFTINAAITDINELNGFVSELKSEFGEIIDSYDTIINSELLKLNYVPF